MIITCDYMLKPIYDYYMWLYVKTDLWLLHVIECMLKPIYVITCDWGYVKTDLWLLHVIIC